MANIANIILADGTTPTAVNRTFVAITGQSGDTQGARWQERSSERPVGYINMGLLVRRRANAATPGNAVSLSINIPELSPSDSTIVIGTAKVNISVVIDDTCTVATRNNLLAFVKNVFAKQEISDAFTGIPAS